MCVMILITFFLSFFFLVTNSGAQAGLGPVVTLHSDMSRFTTEANAWSYPNGPMSTSQGVPLLLTDVWDSASVIPDAATSRPNSLWRLLWGSRATTFLLMLHYCRHSATYTPGISAPFIPSLNGNINFCLSYHLPFPILWRLLIYSKTDQIPFLSAPPNVSSLAIGLLPGSHKIWLWVLLPA